MKDRSLLKGIVVTVATFLAMLILLFIGLNVLNARSDTELTSSLKSTVLRTLLTCYAVEGRYPSEVSYLQQYYGLTYDSDRYIVSLHAFAENLLPVVDVLSVGEV
jgi:hypothetical protein